MTKEEIYDNLLRDYLSDSFSGERLEWALGSFKVLTEQQNIIYEAMQEYADQEVNKEKKIKGIRKEPYDFSGDEEYRHNSNC